jgi:large subunit ribosomal protein L17
MRHQKKTTILGRKTAARRSLIANLAESFILYEKIRTTKAKAKALQPFVEKLITKAKKQDLASRRAIIKQLYTDNAVRKLMDDLAKRYKDREGGYTRIVNLDRRLGDGAEEAIIELI